MAPSLPSNFDDFAAELVDISQDLQAMQERVGRLLQGLLSQSMLQPKLDTAPKFSSKNPHLCEAVARYYSEVQSYSKTARHFGTSERSIRRAVKKVRGAVTEKPPVYSFAGGESAEADQAQNELGSEAEAPASAEGCPPCPPAMPSADRPIEQLTVDDLSPLGPMEDVPAVAEKDIPTIRRDNGAVVISARRKGKSEVGAFLSLGSIADAIVQKIAEDRPYEPPADLGPGGIKVDLDLPKVAGPYGEVPANRPIARVLGHMADGGLYPIKLLAEKYKFEKPEALRSSLLRWEPKLAQIGVEVIWMGKEMLKIRPLGGPTA